MEREVHCRVDRNVVGQTFQGCHRHRVDRRRRHGFPGLYTSPRLKSRTHVGSGLSGGERKEPRKHLRGEDGCQGSLYVASEDDGREGGWRNPSQEV